MTSAAVEPCSLGLSLTLSEKCVQQVSHPKELGKDAARRSLRIPLSPRRGGHGPSLPVDSCLCVRLDSREEIVHNGKEEW